MGWRSGVGEALGPVRRLLHIQSSGLPLSLHNILLGEFEDSFDNASLLKPNQNKDLGYTQKHLQTLGNRPNAPPKPCEGTSIKDFAKLAGLWKGLVLKATC